MNRLSRLQGDEERIAKLPVWAQELIQAQERIINEQDALVRRSNWTPLAPDFTAGEWAISVMSPDSPSTPIYYPIKKYARVVGPAGDLIMREDGLEFYAHDGAVILPGASNLIKITSSRLKVTRPIRL